MHLQLVVRILRRIRMNLTGNIPEIDLLRDFRNIYAATMDRNIDRVSYLSFRFTREANADFHLSVASLLRFFKRAHKSIYVLNKAQECYLSYKYFVF